MKTRTNFFLANLAAADLCVGILCILPNLQTFLYFSWLLGTTMCKIFYFAESFSLCASVLLLAVIAVERYIAVMHPLRARGLFTNYRMHAAQISIWVLSAVYNIPLVAIFDTFEEEDMSGQVTMFCNIRENVINMQLYYTISFILWYILPLITMSVAYTIISWTLWHSGTIFNQRKNGDTNNCPTSTANAKVAQIRDNRSSGHTSSSSSGGVGSVGECSHSGGSFEGELNQHGNGNIMSFDANGKCCYKYCAENPERLHTEDVCTGCGVATTRFNGSRNDDYIQGQSPQQKPEYGSPVCWWWHAKEDNARGDDSRNFRHTSFVRCITSGHANRNPTLETQCLSSTCLHYHKTRLKRQHDVTTKMVPVINSKQRPTRRSFHSDYASDSSPGHSQTYEMTIRQNTSQRVLSSRRKVVRLLVLVFLTFAICVLPHHIRILMFYWKSFPSNSFGMSFFPPLAFMSLYLNSALNPVLYSLFSESFRRSLRECFRRPWHKGISCLSRHTELYFPRVHHGRSTAVEIRME